MKRLVVIALFICGASYGAQPRYTRPTTPDQIRQNDLDLYDSIRNLSLKTRTKAQLQTAIPQSAGEIYYCSDCATDGIVVSTGTGRGAFGRISARGTAIN